MFKVLSNIYNVTIGLFISMLWKIILPIRYIFKVKEKSFGIPRKEKFKMAKNTLKLPDMIFLLIFIFAWTLSSVASNGVVDLEKYVFLNSIYELFPVVNETGADVGMTYIHGNASTVLYTVMAVSYTVTQAIIGGLFMLFMVYLCIDYISASEPTNNITRLSLYSLLIGLSILQTEVTNKDGYTVKISIPQLMALEILGDRVLILEQYSESVDENDLYLVPEIKVLNPLSFNDFYHSIISSYIRGSFTAGEVNKIDIMESGDGTYNYNFEFGGTRFEGVLPQNKPLNDYASTKGIDLKQLEIDMINSLIKDALLQGEYARKALQNVDFYTKQVYGDGRGFDAVTASAVYSKNYKEYCPTIYTNVSPRMNVDTKNSFLSIASFCASHNFVNKLYTGSQFDYEKVISGEGDLRKNHTLLYKKNEIKYSDIEAITNSECSSYMSCTESLQFLQKKERDVKTDLGIMTPLVKVFNNVIERNIDQTTITLDAFKQEESTTGTNVFSNYIIEGNKVSEVSFTSNTDRVITKNDLFESIGNLNQISIPGVSKVLSAYSGGGITRPINRAKTCLKYPMQVLNGFRCEEISKELSAMGSDMILIGLMMKSTKYFPSISKKKPITSASETVMGKIKSTSSASGVGILGNIIGVVGLSVAPEMSLKSSPYLDATTITEVLVLKLILDKTSKTLSDLLDTLSSLLITIGFGIMLIIYWLFLPLIYDALIRVFEIIVDVVVFFPRLLTAIYSRSTDGVKEIIVEFFADLTYLSMTIFILIMFREKMDIILSVFANDFLSMFEILDGSELSFISNIFSIIFKILVLWFVLKAANNRLIGLTEGIFKQVLKAKGGSESTKYSHL